MVNHFWQSVDAILKDVSVTEIIVGVKLLINDYHLSVFQKVRLSDTCNQVKSDTTKHGRLNQS